jgi:Mn2+/Fe2+ NRAMP family transporter
VGDKKIMKEFTLPKWQVYFASAIGIFLFFLNFYVIFEGFGSIFEEFWSCLLIVTTLALYLAFIIMTIRSPVKPLKQLTKEELADHDYEKILIDYDNSISRSFGSQMDL